MRHQSGEVREVKRGRDCDLPVLYWTELQDRTETEEETIATKSERQDDLCLLAGTQVLGVCSDQADVGVPWQRERLQNVFSVSQCLSGEVLDEYSVEEV